MSRILAEALLGITLASGLIAAGLGYLIARQGLAPLHRFAAMAGRITASRLGERLDTSELPQEVRELASSFNHMLERLQDSFRRIEQSSSDLAHEMRTPINTLLGQTQVALSRARSPAEYREVLASNAEEYERLSRMIQDMLFIARADEPHAVLDVEDVELRDEARRVAEFYEPMLDEKRIRLQCHGTGTARADRTLVGRALGNLLSNAVRHSPPGGRIDIDIGTDPVAPDCISLSVVNQGPAIAPEDMPRIFDRFYRAGTGARTEGTGLGLAIVKTIAQLHGGSVGATSELGQTRFVLRLPAGTPGPAHAEPAGFRPALAQRP
jgi:two-component system heavy metal sensor histidine kinase CusS